MPSRSRSFVRLTGWAVAAMAALAMGLALVPMAQAQNQTTTGTTTTTTGVGFLQTRSVGGVSIDARGMLTNATRDEMGKLRQVARDALQPVPEGMNQTAGMRKVSLAGLEAEIKKSLDEGKPLSDAVQCLAGLQRIQYVLAYPEQRDIVLVGPAQGWKLDGKGNLVGAANGQPVMMLDDLIVALRAASTNPAVLSCSINPTPEGIKRVEQFIGQFGGRMPPADKQGLQANFQAQLGPQTISVTGVPETSHFARVMVAADYRMKRISMAFEPSPVPRLPSYMEMLSAGTVAKNMLPRFWLEPQYDSLLRDGEGLAWELRGGSVRTMAETDFFDANKKAHPTGQADPAAKKWASLFTDRYEELSVADPVFGQLRNCMDVAVAATLIVKERLPVKVKNDLPMLLGTNGVPAVQVEAPKHVPSQANLAKKGRSWAIAAGGVQINPWAIVEKSETSQKTAAVRGTSAAKDRAAWWWD